MWQRTETNSGLESDLATLDLLLERRLCNGLEASSGHLWTLPSPGIPDVVLRNHVSDGASRALYASLGSRVFSQAIPVAIAQSFTSYPGNVRTVIEAQMTKPVILSRISSRLPIYAHKIGPTSNPSIPRAQLFYAAVMALSEDHGSDHTTEWLKTLVGNLVPIIMDTVADWEDLGQPGEPGGVGGQEEALIGPNELAQKPGPTSSSFVIIDDRVGGRSNPNFSDLDDPDDLAELLESHLQGLDSLDEDF